MNYQNEFKIQQLRTKNLTAATESISVFIAAVVGNMLVPQLLLKYVYDPATLFEAPPIFEYLPLGLYGFAISYFLLSMFSNFKRSRTAERLEKEMLLDGGCCDGDCSCENEEISEDELKELERIVEEALKPEKKSKAKTKVKAAKKTAKKTAKKKAAKKSK